MNGNQHTNKLKSFQIELKLVKKNPKSVEIKLIIIEISSKTVGINLFSIDGRSEITGINLISVQFNLKTIETELKSTALCSLPDANQTEIHPANRSERNPTLTSDVRNIRSTTWIVNQQSPGWWGRFAPC